MVIIAHHYVVNSGLTDCFEIGTFNLNTYFLQYFGFGGKFAINCFTLITGYFMTEKKLNPKKLLKLWSEVWLYNIVISVIFAFMGYARPTAGQLLNILFPMSREAGIYYTGTMLVMFLLIPFINAGLNRLNKKQYSFLLLLLLFIESFLPSVFINRHNFNFIGWMCILYAVGGYLRKYPIRSLKNIWIDLFGTIFCIGLMFASIYVISRFGGSHADKYYYECADANKILPFLASVFSFCFFKQINIGYHKWINWLAAGSFGVLLIHANSATMRQWLWQDALNNVGHFSDPLPQLVLRSFVSVIVIYLVGAVIDSIRRRWIEAPGIRLLEKVFNKFSLFREIEDVYMSVSLQTEQEKPQTNKFAPASRNQ